MARFDKYIAYIKNVGPFCKVTWFDDDWEPVGPLLRRDMQDAGLIDQTDGIIVLLPDRLKAGENA